MKNCINLWKWRISNNIKKVNYQNDERKQCISYGWSQVPTCYFAWRKKHNIEYSGVHNHKISNSNKIIKII
jgi:hypothetical protein